MQHTAATRAKLREQFKGKRKVEYMRCVCALSSCQRQFELQPAVYRQRLKSTVNRKGVNGPRNSSGKLFCSKRCSNIFMRMSRVKQTGWERILIEHGLGMRAGEHNWLLYGFDDSSVYVNGTKTEY